MRLYLVFPRFLTNQNEKVAKPHSDWLEKEEKY